MFLFLASSGGTRGVASVRPAALRPPPSPARYRHGPIPAFRVRFHALGAKLWPLLQCPGTEAGPYRLVNHASTCGFCCVSALRLRHTVRRLTARPKPHRFVPRQPCPCVAASPLPVARAVRSTCPHHVRPCCWRRHHPHLQESQVHAQASRHRPRRVRGWVWLRRCRRRRFVAQENGIRRTSSETVRAWVGCASDGPINAPVSLLLTCACACVHLCVCVCGRLARNRASAAQHREKQRLYREALEAHAAGVTRDRDRARAFIVKCNEACSCGCIPAAELAAALADTAPPLPANPLCNTRNAAAPKGSSKAGAAAAAAATPTNAATPSAGRSRSAGGSLPPTGRAAPKARGTKRRATAATATPPSPSPASSSPSTAPPSMAGNHFGAVDSGAVEAHSADISEYDDWLFGPSTSPDAAVGTGVGAPIGLTTAAMLPMPAAVPAHPAALPPAVPVVGVDAATVAAADDPLAWLDLGIDVNQPDPVLDDAIGCSAQPQPQPQPAVIGVGAAAPAASTAAAAATAPAAAASAATPAVDGTVSPHSAASSLGSTSGRPASPPLFMFAIVFAFGLMLGPMTARMGPSLPGYVPPSLMPSAAPSTPTSWPAFMANMFGTPQPLLAQDATWRSPTARSLNFFPEDGDTAQPTGAASPNDEEEVRSARPGEVLVPRFPMSNVADSLTPASAQSAVTKALAIAQHMVAPRQYATSARTHDPHAVAAMSSSIAVSQALSPSPPAASPSPAVAKLRGANYAALVRAGSTYGRSVATGSQLSGRGGDGDLGSAPGFQELHTALQAYANAALVAYTESLVASGVDLNRTTGASSSSSSSSSSSATATPGNASYIMCPEAVGVLSEQLHSKPVRSMHFHKGHPHFVNSNGSEGYSRQQQQQHPKDADADAAGNRNATEDGNLHVIKSQTPGSVRLPHSGAHGDGSAASTGPFLMLLAPVSSLVGIDGVSPEWASPLSWARGDASAAGSSGWVEIAAEVLAVRRVPSINLAA